VSGLKKLLPLALLALVAWLALGDGDPQQTGTASDPTVPTDGDTAAGATPGSRGPIMHNIVVRDPDGRIAWRGDIDLGATIARIERGDRDRHRNDGGVFQNREGRLPKRPRGYYREFVVRTPGMSGVGPQRLVIGRDGDAWYSSDHYRSFTRLKIEVRAP